LRGRYLRVLGVAWQFRMWKANGLKRSIEHEVEMPKSESCDNPMVFADRWLKGWHFKAGIGPSVTLW